MIRCGECRGLFQDDGLIKIGGESDRCYVCNACYRKLHTWKTRLTMDRIFITNGEFIQDWMNHFYEFQMRSIMPDAQFRDGVMYWPLVPVGYFGER